MLGLGSLITSSTYLLDIIRSGLKLSLPFTISQQLGEELIANGNFNDGGSANVVDSDSDGVNESRNSTIPNWAISTSDASDATGVNLQVNDSGQLVINSPSIGGDNYTDYGSAVQQLNKPLVANRLYKFEFDLISATPSVILTEANRIRIGTMNNTAGAGSGIKNISQDAAGNDRVFSIGTHVLYFTPTANDTHISITGRDNITQLIVDNISLKEVGPLSLDETTNNNNAKLFTGTALDFDGTNDYVKLPASNTLVNYDSFTIAFWFKSDDTTNGNDRRIFTTGVDSANSYFAVGINSSNQLRMYLRNSSGDLNLDNADNLVSTTIVTDNVYRRVVVVVEASTQKFYVNNKLIRTFTITKGDQYSSVAGFIGCGPAAEDNDFLGQVSDFQLWNVAWSSTDVSNDFVNPNQLVSSVPVSNLKAWWAMTEGSGSILFDSSGQNNPGFGSELAPGSLSIDNGEGGGTITQISGNSFSSTSDGNNTSSIRPKFNFNTESGKTYKLVITPTGSITGTVHFDFHDGSSYLFNDYDFTTTKEIQFQDNGNVFGAFNGQQAYSISGFTISLKKLGGNNGTISGATYVTGESSILQLGMINWGKNLGSELVSNGDFSTSGTFNTANKNLGFYMFDDTAPASDANIDDRGTTISGGTLNLFRNSGSTSNSGRAFFSDGASGNVNIVGGSYYQLEYTITENTAESQLQLYNGAYFDLPKEVNSHIVNFYNGASNIFIAFKNQGDVSSTIKIDNVSLKELKFLPAIATNPTQDVLGNSVRDRLGSINLTGTGYAEIADDNDLDFGTGVFSMECWVKAEFIYRVSSVNVIFSLGGSYGDSDSARFATLQSSRRFRIRIGDEFIDANDSYVVGRWYHLCVTRNSSNLCTFYIDSVPQTVGSGTTKTMSASITNEHEKFIGRDSNTSNRFYSNLIDGVRVYNVELTADQVKQNYNAGTSAHAN
jgi:hypothetical protein